MQTGGADPVTFDHQAALLAANLPTVEDDLEAGAIVLVHCTEVPI